MGDWKTLAQRTVHETAWIKLIEKKFLNHNGTPLTYTYMELQHPSVIVMATDENGAVWMCKKYYPTVGQTMWSSVAGFTDGDEPLEAAKRALHEETGVESDDWESLGESYALIGAANAHYFLFLARNCKQAGEATDKLEDLRDGKFLPIKTIRTILRNKEQMDFANITALYRYLETLDKKGAIV